MIATVRDDIISLESFVQAKFKFEKYLLLLRNAGNYCFLDQFRRLFEKGKVIAKNMEDMKLIKTETLNNNYKYIYLTDTAMKYIILKDDPKDYTGVVKNKISVLKINKYPSEKVLMSSALKFELIANGKGQNILKENLINNLRESFYNQSNIIKIDKIKKEMEDTRVEYNKIIIVENKSVQLLREILEVQFIGQENNLNEFKTQTDTKLKVLEEELQNLGILDRKRKKEIQEEIIELKHELEKNNFCIELRKKVKEQIEKAKAPSVIILKKYNDFKNLVEEYKKEREKNQKIDEQYSNLEKKVLDIYNKSKVIASFEKEGLNLIILDTGNTKTAFGYLKMISELKMFYNFNKTSICIASYSENRAKNLLKKFSDTQEEKNKALKVMDAYEKKTGVDRKNRKSWKYAPSFYVSAENVYYNTPDITNYDYSKETIVLEAYKKNLSMSENYIKNKDKKVFSELKEKFKEQL